MMVKTRVKKSKDKVLKKSPNGLGNRESHVHPNGPRNAKASSLPASVFLEVIISILSIIISLNDQKKVKHC